MASKATTDKAGSAPTMNADHPPSYRRISPVIWTALILALALACLFHKSFGSKWVHFSNDGPYGNGVAQQGRLPDIFFGDWSDLNWFGNEYFSAASSLTNLFRWLVSPLTYSQFLPFASLLFVGSCASFCFRKLGLAPVACVLGGLAAGLNSDFFSTSCWGVASQVVGFGGMYLALGLVYESDNSLRGWMLVIVAGLGVGLGIMEAYDIGALFSIFVGVFVMFHSLFIEKGSVPGRIGSGIGKLAIVAVFSALVSASSLITLIGTQVVGVASAQQDKEAKERAWPGATEWSLPKKETLQVIIPGIFGYRNQWHMYDDGQPHEDQYWGTIGMEPTIDMARAQLKNPDPQVQAQAQSILQSGSLLWRLVGTGFYAGVPVVMIALWGVCQSFRRKDTPFNEGQRRVMQFWAVALVICLLLSFGKYAPFYEFFYALPYASAIRNPDKFMHILSWALVLLFAGGVHGLYLTCMQPKAADAGGGLVPRFKQWYASAPLFQRSWLNACLGVLGVSLLGWLIYASELTALQDYLKTVGIHTEDVNAVARFSVSAVGWFALLLAATTVLLGLIFSGNFSGQKARFGVILLGVLLVFDLARADMPWIFYWDVNYKYAADPIIKLLADKPYEHRVTMLPIPADNEQLALLQNAYGSHWKQHLFMINNIQCTDTVQEPRISSDKDKFNAALPLNSFQNFLRFWELSNTKYVLGPGAGAHVLERLGPLGQKFKIVQSFDFVPRIAKPNPQYAVNFAAQPKPDGQDAVLEFIDALPRASLFSNWQISTNDDETLKLLASPSFDPHQVVLVSDASLPPPKPGATNENAVAVEINPNYQPKRVQMEADVKTPSVLMLADRYNPKWQVEVDGKPAKLLRCNFIMRGVYLEPGKHDVVFRFEPDIHSFYISIAAIGFALVLSCVLAFTGKRGEAGPAGGNG